MRAASPGPHACCPAGPTATARLPTSATAARRRRALLASIRSTAPSRTSASAPPLAIRNGRALMRMAGHERLSVRRAGVAAVALAAVLGMAVSVSSACRRAPTTSSPTLATPPSSVGPPHVSPARARSIARFVQTSWRRRWEKAAPRSGQARTTSSRKAAPFIKFDPPIARAGRGRKPSCRRFHAEVAQHSSAANGPQATPAGFETAILGIEKTKRHADLHKNPVGLQISPTGLLST